MKAVPIGAAARAATPAPSATQNVERSQTDFQTLIFILLAIARYRTTIRNSAPLPGDCNTFAAAKEGAAGKQLRPLSPCRPMSCLAAAVSTDFAMPCVGRSSKSATGEFVLQLLPHPVQHLGDLFCHKVVQRKCVGHEVYSRLGRLLQGHACRLSQSFGHALAIFW